MKPWSPIEWIEAWMLTLFDYGNVLFLLLGIPIAVACVGLLLVVLFGED